MTIMHRVTVAFPDDVDSAILALRSKKEFQRCSYSEIVRRLVNLALDCEEGKESSPAPTDA